MYKACVWIAQQVTRSKHTYEHLIKIESTNAYLSNLTWTNLNAFILAHRLSHPKKWIKHPFQFQISHRFIDNQDLGLLQSQTCKSCCLRVKKAAYLRRTMVNSWPRPECAATYISLKWDSVHESEPDCSSTSHVHHWTLLDKNKALCSTICFLVLGYCPRGAKRITAQKAMFTTALYMNRQKHCSDCINPFFTWQWDVIPWKWSRQHQ